MTPIREVRSRLSLKLCSPGVTPGGVEIYYNTVINIRDNNLHHIVQHNVNVLCMSVSGHLRVLYTILSY